MQNRSLPRKKKEKNGRKSGRPKREAPLVSQSEEKLPVPIVLPAEWNDPVDLAALDGWMVRRVQPADLRSVAAMDSWRVMKMNREEFILTGLFVCRQSEKARHRTGQKMMKINLCLCTEENK